MPPHPFDSRLCARLLGHPEFYADSLPHDPCAATSIEQPPTKLILDEQATFYQFNKLPKEIRLMIWEFALPGPRIVFLRPRRLQWFQCTRVFSDRHTDTQPKSPSTFEREDFKCFSDSSHHNGEYIDAGGSPRDRFGFRSESSISMLYVCRESYCVASKIYRRAFGTKHAFPQTWFSFELDTLYMHLEGRVSNLKEIGDMENVRRMALRMGCDGFPTTGLTRRFVSQRANRLCGTFPNLRTFTSVAQRHDDLCTDLVFIDLKDISSLLELYSKSYDKDAESMCLTQQMYYTNAAERAISVSSRIVDRYRSGKRRTIEDTTVPPYYAVPKIDMKIITTARMKSKLDRAEAHYLAEKKKASIKVTAE